MCIYMNRETTNQLNSQWEGGRVLPSVVPSQTMASISLWQTDTRATTKLDFLWGSFLLEKMRACESLGQTRRRLVMEIAQRSSISKAQYCLKTAGP